MKKSKQKKYFEGGIAKGYKQPEVPKKKLSTKGIDYATDVLKSTLNVPANILRLDVGQDQYKTSFGKKADQATNVAGKVLNQGATGALNFLAPGAGTAFQVGTQALGQVQGDDESLTTEQQKTLNAIDQVGGGLNSAFALTQISKDNPKGIFNGMGNSEDEATAGYEKDKEEVYKKAKAMGVAKKGGVVKGKGGKLVNGNLLKGNSHAKGGIKIEVEDGEQEIEAEGDEIILSKGVYRDPKLRGIASMINVLGGGKPIEKSEEDEEYAADGIVTGKRKNSTGIAAADKLLDEAYSNQNLTSEQLKLILEKVKALTQSKGIAPGLWNDQVQDFDNYIVKKSNSELKSFSAKTKIDKENALIANAVNDLKKSGASSSEVKAFENTIKNEKAGNVIDIKLKAAKDAIGTRVELENNKSKAKTTMDLLDKKLIKAGELNKKINSNPESFTPEQIAKVKKDLIDVNDVRDRVKKYVSNGNYDEAQFVINGNKSLFDEKEIKAIKYVESKPKSNPLTPGTSKPNLAYADNTVKEQKGVEAAKTGIAGATANPKALATDATKKAVDPSKVPMVPKVEAPEPQTLGKDEFGNDVSLNPNADNSTFKTMPNLLGVEGAKALTVPQNPAATTTNTTTTPAATTAPKTKTPFDYGAAVGGIQALTGVAALAKDGKAPEYQVNQNLVKGAEDLRKESGYGFNPLTTAAANDKIELTRRTSNVEGQNLTGGSAGAQLAFQTTTGLNAMKSYTDLAKESENFRLQKKNAMFNMDQAVAQESKYAFEQKLNMFDKRQQSGAFLMNKGIENMIGSQRYADALAAEKKRNSYGESITKNMAQTTDQDIQKEYDLFATPEQKKTYPNSKDWYKVKYPGFA